MYHYILVFKCLCTSSCVSEDSSSREKRDVIGDAVIVAKYKIAIDLTPEGKEPVRIEAMVQSVQAVLQAVADEGIEVDKVKASAKALSVVNIPGVCLQIL